MGFFRDWRRRRILARHPVDDALWAEVRQALPILDGLDAEEDARLRERSVLFLAEKHLSLLGDLQLDARERLLLAAQAQLPLLHLEELGWYQGFHELVIYPDDFVSPQRHRDSAGVVHEWDDERSGEAWHQGPVVLAWPGIQANGDANGLPPLHRDMRQSDWAEAMQSVYDELNARLDEDENAELPIDPYAAEDPAEFFAVTSEYFFTAPDLLQAAYPGVYAQLRLFYRQDPGARLARLQAEDPAYRDTTNG